jgi:hypothetical protein
VRVNQHHVLALRQIAAGQTSANQTAALAKTMNVNARIGLEPRVLHGLGRQVVDNQDLVD